MHLYHIIHNGNNMLALISIKYKKDLSKYLDQLKLKLIEINKNDIKYEVKYVDVFKGDFLDEGLWAINENSGKLRKFV